MADVLDFPIDGLVAWGRDLRRARETEGLTLKQAAAALEISPVTLDSWEQGRKPQKTAAAAAEKYLEYRKNTNFHRDFGNNLLFGAFPVRVAKDLLGVNTAELAGMMGYSVSSWTKMEANARVVPEQKIRQLEELVGAALDSACTSSRNLS